MNIFKTHIDKIVIVDYLLTNDIKNCNYLPKLEQTVLTSRINLNHKQSLFVLIGILTFLKPCITFCKKNVLNINIKKGNPVGIKIILKKKHIENFLTLFLFELLPSLKKLTHFKSNKNNIVQIQIEEIFNYEDIYETYIYISNISILNVSISGNNLKRNFFNSLRLPIKKDK
jgi:ribosomal protein L5